MTRDIFDGVLVLEQPPVTREESMTRARRFCRSVRAN